MQREWEQRAQSDAFGYIGRGYAESDALFWSSGETDLTQLILEGLSLKPTSTALEIGCGVGRLIRPLSSRVAQVTGVDIAPGMISRGQKLLSDRSNVTLRTTDGSLRMLTDNSHDFAFSFVVFQHIPTKQAIIRYLRETARILKPGGIFKFQVDGRQRPFWKGSDTWLGAWFQPTELRDLLNKMGFSIVDTWGEATQYYWITARWGDASDENPVNVSVHPPRWNRNGVTALLRRLNHPDPEDWDDITTGRHFLRDCTRQFQSDHAKTSPQEFIQAAFRTILDREADATGHDFYLRQLSGQATRSYVIDCLLSSAELRGMVRDPAVTTP